VTSPLNRVYRRTAAGLALLMLTNAIVSGTVVEPAAAFDPFADLRRDRPVEVTPLEPGGGGFVDPSANQLWNQPAALALPPPGTTTFDLDAGAPTATASDEFPVAMTGRTYWSGMPQLGTSGSAAVTIHGAQAARAAGVAGLLLQVDGEGSGVADLTVHYASFADLFGAGWGARLQLVELPACATTTPRAAGCLKLTPVDSRNNTRAQTVSAAIRLEREPTSNRVFAVTATAASEGAGDYRATDLSPAGSWTSGGNDGAFTYEYPLRLPPAAGPVPSMALGYSSASHDGRTSGANNQASWVGDGWGYEPGFVERSYPGCSLDDEGSNNNPDVTGDLCWDRGGVSMTMSLNGSNTTLVRDDASGVWRAQADANWRIELLGSPASSSAGTSERWKVTTPDGIQYWFASEASASSSRWTVPVFGNHSGEPCRASSFASSSCRQAYRWMLDKVIDTHGNMVRYFYTMETGNYGAAGDANNRVAYDRGGRLERIEYGLRGGDASVAATGRVILTPGNRCLSNCGTPSSPIEENWPETPWDLHCAAAPCTTQLSPVFFSTSRLAKITTQVRNGTGYRDVDSWTLTHEFKDYGDAEQVTLWLKSIQHAGHVGGTSSLPTTVFGGEALPNRVDAAAGVPVMWRWRMSSIKTETGAVITVTYDPTQCSPSNLPAEAHVNSMRCFPVRWTPEFFVEPIEDWFHKHVVSSVVETDTTGGMVAVETHYAYATAGGGTSVLWAFDDSEFTEDEHRTYNQWRGYSQVTTRRGDPAQIQTVARSRFYRGLDGQPLPGDGTRNVSVTDEEGNAVADHEALAGREWEALSYDGTTVIEGNTYQYWTRNTATQARDHDGGDLQAWLSGVTVEKARTRLTSTVWQRAETRTSFDTQGRVTQINSLGDSTENGDETCTRTEYTDNTTAWIKDAIKRVETVEVSCGTTPSRPADVASDMLTFFDGSDTHGATPSRGAPTRVDELDQWSGGPVYVTTMRTGYDALGRAVMTADALNRTSTTAYTPAGAGPLTQTVLTNALGHVSTTQLEPAWGVPTATVEPNGRRTDLTYDPLGRSTAIWLPGRNKNAQPPQTPNRQFEYLVRDNAPSAVVTRTLNQEQEYIIDVTLYDSLLRQRQTQTETWDRGRLVTETIYDSQGRVDEEFGPNHNMSPPDPAAIVRVREEESVARTGYLYDAASRVTDQVFYNQHVERWRTRTTYGGSTAGFLTTVQPPLGAPATATITDARGRAIENRTFHSNSPAGAADSLAYEYSPTGRLESMTDQASNQWSWEYDLRGRQAVANDPDAGTTRMTYDAANQLISTTDARGQTVVNGYDDLGRQTSRHDGDDTLLAEWQYDTALNGIGMVGRATRWANGNPYTNEVHAVNAQGLVTLTSVTLPPSEGALAGRYLFSQNYLPNGQVSGQTLQGKGNLERASIFFDYDHVGNPTRLFYEGQFTGVVMIVDETTFTPFNEIQTRRLGESRFAHHGFEYEEGTRRLKRATFDREASLHNVADLRYTYDPAGNITSIADVPQDLPGNHELQCFRYDHQRRLTEAWAQADASGCASTPSMSVLGGPAPYWNTYAHDDTGNRTSETLRLPGRSAVIRNYDYPDAGDAQPHAVQEVTGTDGTMSFDYDEAGNTSGRSVGGNAQTLHWDPEGKLEAVDQASGNDLRMVYDADGNRLVRDDGQTVTAYLPQTELTLDKTTGTIDGTRYFSHAGQVVAVCTGRDVADWTWMGVDQHGTTASHAINAFTAVEQVRRTDPYGSARGQAPQAWPGQQGFAGGVQDPTGLVHIGARSYDPLIGRFISVDPLLALGDTQQINGYAYAYNNPVTFTDPTGLSATNCTPDGYSLCPDQPASQQPTYDLPSNRGGSTAPRCNNPVQCDAWAPNPSYPQVVQAGSVGDTDWKVYDDGTVVVNGVPLPPGAPTDPATLAAKINEQMSGWDDVLLTDDPAARLLALQLATVEAVGNLCAVLTGEYGCDADFHEGIIRLHGDLNKDGYAMAWEWSAGAWTPLRGLGSLRGSGGLRGQPCPSSFTAGTLVLMADGTAKPIEEVEVGDLVLATDPETGNTQPGAVVDTITSSGDKVLVEVSIATQGSPPVSVRLNWLDRVVQSLVATVTATENHLVWDTAEVRWVRAGDLQRGDQLLTADGERARITASHAHTDTRSVYNLAIAGIHTYYVLAGEIPVLVHNAPPSGCRITSGVGSPRITSQTVWTDTNRTMRVDVENPSPGKPGAAGIHAQFMGRGADPTKYYYKPSDGTWVSEAGLVLSPRIAGQIPQSAINRAYQVLGIP
jgi:RHS repeat-associated protein